MALNMKLSLYRVMALITLVLLSINERNAFAQDTYFPTDATIATSITNNAIVGYANAANFNNGTNGTSPTVALINGGSIGGYLYVGNSSMVNVSGGSIGSFLYGFNSSMIDVSGGTIGASVTGNDNSLISVAGGNIQYEVYANNNSTINVSGGTIGDSLFAQDSSTINVSGGAIGGSLYVTDSGTLNLFGMGLSSSLIDPNYQDFYSEYDLSGALQDGANVSGMSLFVQNGSGAQVTITNAAASVPESGTLILFGWIGMTGVAFLRPRRRAR
jgi:hypothetical protein